MSEFYKNHKRRMSGVLAHPTSFPSPYGIGDLGQGAYDFIDFLVRSKQTLWQVLPLGPTGYGDSPYQSYSSFAGQTLCISPERMVTDGLLTEADIADPPVSFSDKADYGSVIWYKTKLYQKAYENFQLLDRHCDFIRGYQAFCEEHRSWLEDFALYAALKEYNGGKPWLEWEDDLRVPNTLVISHYQSQLKDSITYFKFLQYLFYKQWFELKNYANDRGIFIVGDIPIFVALDGCDTWANQSLFQLDSRGFPTVVSGVPPDYFSATGQLWGNPLYDWDKMRHNHYDWWIHRIKHQLHLTDYLRIDHFRGFEAYWAVPYGETTAINGTWKAGPYMDFFYALRNALGDNLPIFAEDLGVITPEVEKLRDDFHLPGMKILQFAFEDLNDNHFLPYNYPENCICYTGTHDNDTTLGWYQNARPECREKVRAYMNTNGTDIAWDFIRLALSSPARYAVIPLQDILGYGSEARMNIPGRAAGNWQWRYPDGALTDKLADRLGDLTALYSRA